MSVHFREAKASKTSLWTHPRITTRPRPAYWTVKQAHLPRWISGSVGLRANHGKRSFVRKSHSRTLVIGFYGTSPVDMAPAMKASGATYPCAHVQVDEKAGNVSGCVAESACCRKLSAQPCQHSSHHYLFRWPMKPNLRHAGNRSGCLVRSNRLRLEFALKASRPTHHS